MPVTGYCLFGAVLLISGLLSIVMYYRGRMAGYRRWKTEYKKQHTEREAEVQEWIKLVLSDMYTDTKCLLKDHGKFTRILMLIDIYGDEKLKAEVRKLLQDSEV